MTLVDVDPVRTHLRLLTSTRSQAEVARDAGVNRTTINVIFTRPRRYITDTIAEAILAIPAPVAPPRSDGGDPDLRERTLGPWSDQAACRGTDPDTFFPTRGESSEPAKAICRGCPVQAACAEHAITHHETHGVWGGLSERERRRIRAARNGQRRPQMAAS